uniref:Uncharacterized protein n=1 Tax=Kwoniella bestiolae CBS 10118 TaxID=1296100 RepID=A0A1B9G8Z4_9TREE|nr:hypothetical protein I302_02357 [Kwoniella bestiolae CBS 10118]OCF27515.1 hypothetical protein I302_02357 [Kwoniella bestiolae CBS 10118]
MTGLQHTVSSADLSSDGVNQEAESSTSASRQAMKEEQEAGGSGDMVETDIETEDPSSGPSSSASKSQDGVEVEQGEGEGDKDDIVMDESKPDGEVDEEPISGMIEEDTGNINGEGEGDDLDNTSNQDGKRVKVYELQDTSWHDRGTGFCKGIYDDTQDIALIIVEKEDFSSDGGKVEASGGFLKEELLLSARVEKEDIYGKQQDTLIVWTEPATGLDMALSFQDPEGCEDIWQFICEVQRHLLSMTCKSHSYFLPLFIPRNVNISSNTSEQEMFIRMQAKSPIGRERAVEHILNEDYIKHLITVLEQAEDLESLEDLHALCSLMQTIILFNDNGVFEYILQDDVFMGVMGMLEYDPEFPGLKASYRQYFQETARFRQVVEIKDENIRNKIHQTYRLLYLKDVVLARVLDDPTFNILNGFVFFNQVDIINYIQQNDAFLNQLFSGFHDSPSTSSPSSSLSKAEPLDERKRDVVIFLHQLMIMGKGVQLPGRLALYRNLVERGLLFVCEWAFRRSEAQLLHAGAEILTLAVEHDANVVRLHVFKEDEAKRRTLVLEIIHLLHTTKNLGLMSQMSDTLRTLMEVPPENEVSGVRFKPPDLNLAFVARTKEGPLSESFSTYFYEHCASVLYKPLLDAPDIKAELSREHIALLQHLIELLSFSIINHAHKASYFVLANPVSKKVVQLLYVKDKPLRHACLRYIRACLKTSNHFMHRYYVKNDLFLPLLELLEEESVRDNMMSSACMDVLELIRRDNLKVIINYLFETYRLRLDKLSSRAFLRKYISGLRNRWEINNEPPPPVQQPSIVPDTVESSKAQAEEDYFNGSDDEEAEPATATAEVPSKRKRMFTHGGGPKKRPAGARKQVVVPGNKARRPAPESESEPGPERPSSALGLDYDDGSDSDSSTGQKSPRNQPISSMTSNKEEGDEGEGEGEGLEDVQMRMRAKRQREEEEEEGFAGLLVGAKGTPNPDPTKEEEVVDEGKDKDLTKGTGSGTGNSVKDMGKKIRLNLGFGKKLGK